MLVRIGNYGLVSAFCFALNNALLIGLSVLPLWLNLSLSGAVVITAGYALQSRFTFHAPMSWAALGRYSLVMLPNLPVSYGLLWMFSHWLPMHFNAPLVTGLLLSWNAVGSIWALRVRRAMSQP